MSSVHVAPRHSAVVVGRFGENQLVAGWHEREEDGRYGIPYRAAGAEATLYLRRSPTARRIYILLSGPVGLRRAPLDGRLIIDRKKHQLPLAIDGWVLRTYPIETEKEALRVRFLLPEPAVPDAVLNNGDVRPLGWFLSAIWQE